MLRRLIKYLQTDYAGYVLVAPCVIALGAVLYYPAIKGLIMTFQQPYGSGWVGLQNYFSVWGSPTFQYSLVLTLVFLLSTIVLQISIGLGIALILDKLTTWLKSALTSLAVLPYMVPPVAGGIIWVWMFEPSMGFINVMTRWMGIGSIYFLTDKLWPVFSIIVAQTWKDFGYATVIYLGYLKQIPPYQYEAAEIDGASAFQQFRHITLPHLRTATLIILSIRTTWNIVEFALPLEMTSGGPGGRTELLSILMYKLGFVKLDLNSAYTVGTAMILFSIGAFLLYTVTVGRKESFEV